MKRFVLSIILAAVLVASLSGAAHAEKREMMDLLARAFRDAACEYAASHSLRGPKVQAYVALRRVAATAFQCGSGALTYCDNMVVTHCASVPDGCTIDEYKQLECLCLALSGCPDMCISG